MDLSGTIVELATLQAEANQTPEFQKHGRRAPFPASAQAAEFECPWQKLSARFCQLFSGFVSELIP